MKENRELRDIIKKQKTKETPDEPDAFEKLQNNINQRMMDLDLISEKVSIYADQGFTHRMRRSSFCIINYNSKIEKPTIQVKKYFNEEDVDMDPVVINFRLAKQEIKN